MKNMQKVIKEFCLYQEQDDKKTIILNLSEFENPEVQAYLQKFLPDSLLQVEKERYEKEKDQLEKIAFKDRFFELFLKNESVIPYVRGIICTSEQYLRQTLQIQQYESILQFLLFQRSKYYRGLQVTNIELFPEQVKQIQNAGHESRMSIQFAIFKQKFQIQYAEQISDLKQNKEKALQLAKFADICQKLDIAPILDVDIEFQYPTDIQTRFKGKRQEYTIYLTEMRNHFFREVEQLLAEVVFQLQVSNIELEHVVILNNIASTIAKTYYLIPTIQTADLQEFARKISFWTLRTLYRTLPPCIPGAFNTFNLYSSEIRYLFHLLNESNNNSMQSMTVQGTGIILNYHLYEEIAKSYGLVQRNISGHLTMNDIIEKIFKAQQGQFQDEEEQLIKGPIIVGRT